MRQATISFVVSLRPHGTTRLPQEGCSLNWMKGNLPNIFAENSILLISCKSNWNFLQVYENIFPTIFSE